MKQRKTWELAAAASIPLMMTLGNSMLIPILPAIAEQLGVSSLQVSMIITAYAVVAIIFIPFAGYLSDRFGRKIIIVPSLALAAIGGTVAGVGAWLLHGATAYAVILAGRVLQGIGSAGATPIVLPLVGDMYESEEDVSRGLGIIETSNTFGKVFSPIVGSALALWTWYSPFLAIPAFCLISLLLIASFVPASNRADAAASQRFGAFWNTIKQMFRQKGRWLLAVFAIGGICMFVVFGILFYLSTVLENRYGIDGIVKGLILAIPLSALCLASYLTGKLVGEHAKRMKWVTFAGMALLSSAIMAMIGLPHIVFMLTMLFVGGIGLGAALPSLDAMITEGIAKEQRGTITSLYSSFRFIGVSLGPPVVSLVLSASSEPALFGLMAAIGAAAAVIALFAIHPGQEAKKTFAFRGSE